MNGCLELARDENVQRYMLCALAMAGWFFLSSGTVNLAQGAGMSRIYVAQDGNHSDGTSWANAYTSIHVAVSQSGAGDRIYVKGDTYYLSSPIVISGHPGLMILGGYEGVGTPGHLSAQPTVFARSPDLSPTAYRRLVEGSFSTMTWYRVTFTDGRSSNRSGGAIYLNQCDATFNDVRVRNQYWRSSYASIYGGGLYSLGGRVRILNSRFENNAMDGSAYFEYGHGVGMAARGADVFISNTVFSANRMQQNAGGCRGGGVYLEDGTAVIAQSTFRDNWLSPTQIQDNIFHGAGLYASNVTSLVVNDTVFTGNGASFGNSIYDWLGNAIYMTGAALTASVERVTITGNGNTNSTANRASAIYLAQGVAAFNELTLTNNHGSGFFLRDNSRLAVTNALIARNSGHGISADAGTIDLAHVTMVDNLDPKTATWAMYLINAPHVTGFNNIIYYNGEFIYNLEQVNLSNTQNVYLAYTCSMPLLNGEGNTDRSPEFQDRAGSDYRLRPGSGALDSGTNLTGIARDLVGNPRPVDGRGDGFEIADMGAYERPPADVGGLEVNFAVWPAEMLQATNYPLTLYVYATGADTNLVWFEWDLTGDGNPDLTGANLWTVKRDYFSGWHDITLTVRNSSGETVTRTRPAYIRVLDTVFVSNDGLHQTPFRTQEDAATNIVAAMSVVQPGGIVRMAPGEYLIEQSIDIPDWLTLLGVQGWSNTTVRMTGTGRVIHMQHPRSVVDGLTLRNGRGVSGINVLINSGSLINSRVTANVTPDVNEGETTWDGAIYMTGGMVSNCLVVGNTARNGGGIFMTGNALVTDSTIISNRAGFAWWEHTYGGGIYMSGGTVRNSSVISNKNWFGRSDDFFGFGGGMYVANGLVENVYVTGNDAVRPLTGKGDSGGILQAGGLIDRVTINYNVISNMTAAHAAGIRMTGGILRNALIAGNQGGGLRLQGGTAVNVTIVGNQGEAYGGIYQVGGSVENSIAWHNQNTDPDADPDFAGSITNAIFTSSYALPHDPAGTGNLTNAPGFRDSGSGIGRSLTGGDFRLMHFSSNIDTGVNQPWMADAVCLDGLPRIIKGWLHKAIPPELYAVDRGAYEFKPPVKGSLLQLY